MPKIYISGGPGSGKSTYAKALAKKLGIPVFDLDEVKWINRPDVINCRRPDTERDSLLTEIISKNKDWIIEGVYFQDWIIPVIRAVDKVVILKPPRYIRQYRIIKRSISRMLGFIPKKHKENPIELWRLLKWSHYYETKYLPMLTDKVNRHNKTYEFIEKLD